MMMIKSAILIVIFLVPSMAQSVTLTNASNPYISNFVVGDTFYL